MQRGVAVGSPTGGRTSVRRTPDGRAAQVIGEFRDPFVEPLPTAVVAADGVTVLSRSTVVTSAAHVSASTPQGGAVHVVRWELRPLGSMGTADLRMSAAASGSPANDTWQSATPIAGLPFSSSSDMTLATHQAGETMVDVAGPR